jgi:hypothetical protein
MTQNGTNKVINVINDSPAPLSPPIVAGGTPLPPFGHPPQKGFGGTAPYI